ncbi:MAG: hypothetical protein M0026_08770 [Nocardiopsaceae bacterium]|nr:hypothetical protein [Nocardiopsaceae bacterium]
MVPPIDAWIAAEFTPGRLAVTLDELVSAQEARDSGHTREITRLRETIAECDRRLAQHRAALEAGTDPATVAEWIREVQADRALANAQLDERKDAPNRLSEDEIAAHLEALGDISIVIRKADRETKNALYTGLDLRLTYHPVERVVRAEANLNSHDMYKGSCPRGETNLWHMPSPCLRPSRWTGGDLRWSLPAGPVG